MSVTLTNLRNGVYDLLREEQNSSAYPYTLVDQMINSAQLRICNGQVINPLNKEAIKKGRLPFLNSDKFYSNIQSTALSSATTIWATTLSVADTSNYPTIGTLFVNGNIVTYTGTTSTSFIWCSWVNFAHPAWVEVAILFSLPTDYATPIQVIYNYNYKLEAREYDDIFENLNSVKGNDYWRQINTYPSLTFINPFYSILNGTYLAPFNINNTGDMIHLRYEKLPSEMTIASDIATIDNDIYAKSTIPYLCAGEVLFNRGEESRASQILNFWLWQVKEMYTFYNNKTFEKISWTQYKIWKSSNYNF